MLKDYKGGAGLSEGEAFNPSPANIESRIIRTKLANGGKLALLPKQTRGGTVVVQVRLDIGDEKAVFGKSATAQLTGALLMRGTKNKSRQQIQDEMDRLKAQMGASGSATAATASIETTEANFAGALKLAAELLREPAFPENEFEQVRQQRIAAIESSRSDPTALAQMELTRHLNPYPRGDVRYVGTPDEQIEDLKKVTLDDVKKYHAQFYGASHAEIVISGQFDKAEAQKLADELFGSWKSPSPFSCIASSYQKIEPLDRKIETPDKPNALFILGERVKMTDEDPDYPAMVLANYMLGGNPGARLFKRIRDKEGLSYGVQSVFNVPTKDDAAIFVGLAISAPQNTPKVEISFKDELARTSKDGFTADEVSSAKKSWLEERTVGRSQDQALAGLLVSREFTDRTMKFDEALEAKMAALTPEQVSAAFRRHIDLAALTVVKAGDFKKAAVLQ